MAFALAGLARVASSQGDAPSIWSYTTADTIATVNTADYFLEAINEIDLGDLIYVQSSTGGTRVATLVWVVSNDGTAIDVTDGTTLAATDSD